tara:strand:- start:1846 stop:2094 length:249 start_codon:yes stop_codon:yes gene_type:complete
MSPSSSSFCCVLIFLYLVQKYAREPIKSKKNDTKGTLLLLLASPALKQTTTFSDDFSKNEISGRASGCKSTATDDRVRLFEL